MLTDEQLSQLAKGLETDFIGVVLADMGVDIGEARPGVIRQQLKEKIGEEEFSAIVERRRSKDQAGELPNLRSRLGNRAGAARRPARGAFHTGNLKASDATITDRSSICAACPEFLSESGQCRKCGCLVQTKIALLHEECPLKKW